MKYVLGLLTLGILIVVIIDVFCSPKFTSNIILAITAIIVLWYTYETHLSRKANFEIANANNELIKRSRRPSVGYKVFVSENDPQNTVFEIVNYSEHPVAVKVLCNFSLKGEKIENEWQAYRGEEYWNLQFNQVKSGQFNILDLLKTEIESELISKSKNTDYFKEKVFSNEKFISILNTIEMEVQITTQNHLGDFIKYPIEHYKFNATRKTWISMLTSKKPYWEES